MYILEPEEEVKKPVRKVLLSTPPPLNQPQPFEPPVQPAPTSIVTCDKSNYGKLMHGIFFQVWIDNFVFRLHCKVTVFILFVACVLVSVGQFLGDPIDCIVAVSCS